VYSPGVKQLSPGAYLAMNAGDAERLDARPGDLIEFTLSGIAYRVSLKIHPDLPEGVAGLPAGVDFLQGISLPKWSRIERAQ